MICTAATTPAAEQKHGEVLAPTLLRRGQHFIRDQRRPYRRPRGHTEEPAAAQPKDPATEAPYPGVEPTRGSSQPRSRERKPNQAATASVIPVRAGRGPEPPPPTVDASSDAEWREVDAFRPESLRQERDSPPAVVESGDSDA